MLAGIEKRILCVTFVTFVIFLDLKCLILGVYLVVESDKYIY